MHIYIIKVKQYMLICQMEKQYFLTPLSLLKMDVFL